MAVTIDEVIATAGVSRGTFYKYFASTDALLQALALEITDELIHMADPLVLQHEDPAERVACGIRLVSRLALMHPLAAGCLARLAWPSARSSLVTFDFVLRDLELGFRKKRFLRMPVSLAVNIVSGAVVGAIHTMLQPGSDKDFAEQTAAAALRGLGLPNEAATAVAFTPLPEMQIPTEGLLAMTLTALGQEP